MGEYHYFGPTNISTTIRNTAFVFLPSPVYAQKRIATFVRKLQASLSSPRSRSVGANHQICPLEEEAQPRAKAGSQHVLTPHLIDPSNFCKHETKEKLVIMTHFVNCISSVMGGTLYLQVLIKGYSSNCVLDVSISHL